MQTYYSHPFAQIHNYSLAPTYTQKTSTHKNKEKTLSGGASTRRGSTDSVQLGGKFKTEMCKYYLMQLECPFSYLCCFAHGEEELRSKESVPAKYKTKPCSKFNLEGYCPYGHRCQFIHSPRKQIIKYQRIVDQIRNDPELFFQSFEEDNRGVGKRLSFFQKLSEQQFEEADKRQVSDLEYESCYYRLGEESGSQRVRYNSF